MRIFVTGGSGFVGSMLTRRLAAEGHSITILTRRGADSLPGGMVACQGDPTTPGPWQKELAEHDAVINLAGASIFTRWNAEVRRNIVNSRILTTRNVVEALAQRQGKETLLISTSAVGYYGSRSDDAVLDEWSHPGKDFLADLSKEWEAEAKKAEGLGARVVICRFGIVLGRGGGALGQMVPVFKRGLGSPLGGGKQWFSWIHEEDLFRIMVFLMDRRDIRGPVNCTAPNPVRNAEMTRMLAKALGSFAIAPAVPGFLIKAVMGDFGEVILKGQRVIPRRLLEEGFQFAFPTMPEALQDLLGR